MKFDLFKTSKALPGESDLEKAKQNKNIKVTRVLKLDRVGGDNWR